MHRYCECCDMQEVENAFHFVFDCPLNAMRRLEMTDMIDRLTLNDDYFGWKRMSWNQKLAFLLGDGPTPSTNHDVNLQCSGGAKRFSVFGLGDVKISPTLKKRREQRG